MLRRVGTVLVLGLISGLLYLLDLTYPAPNLNALFLTAVSMLVLYVLFKVLIQELVSRRIGQSKTRYVFRKANSVLYLGATAVVVARIWVQDPQALVVAYGIVGAGIAVSLQDFFENFVGGIVLFVTGNYQVGDRIEVDGTTGDVIDIGLMYTRVMEIQGWVNGDQPTGRIVNVPNGVILGSQTINATKDNTFLWEELSVPITYDSDWERARELMQEIIQEATAEMTGRAEDEMEEIRKKYLLSTTQTDTRVFMELTDNWVQFHARFIVDARKRRRMHNQVSEKLLRAFEDEDGITIASETVAIEKVPDIRMGRD
jgi:small-conductance mechanosensitive channel